MADFDPRDVPLDVALDGKDMIDPYSEKQIHDVSPTAAAFHYWVRFLTTVHKNYIIHIPSSNHIYYCFDQVSMFQTCLIKIFARGIHLL